MGLYLKIFSKWWLILSFMKQVHLFGEGKVNQQDASEKGYDVTRLPRFKWGVCVFFCYFISFLTAHSMSIAAAEY